MTGRLCPIAVVTVLLGWAGPSHAETVSTGLAVVSIPGSQAPRSVADERAQLLLDALDDPTVSSVVQCREALLRAVGPREPDRVGEMANRARRLLEAFEDLAATERALRRAIAASIDILPLQETLDRLMELVVGLATVELALNRDEAVGETLMLGLALDPAFDLEAGEFSPGLVRALRRAREAERDRPVLDGEQARTLGRRLRVGQFLLVQPRPDAARTMVELYQSGTGHRLRRWLITGDDFSSVVAVIHPRGTSEAAGASSDGGDEAPTTTAVSETGREAETADDGQVVLFGQEPEEPEQAPRRRRWYSRWWFWTLVGVVVAGGAATGIVLGLGVGRQEPNLPLEVRGHW